MMLDEGKVRIDDVIIKQKKIDIFYSVTRLWSMRAFFDLSTHYCSLIVGEFL